MSVLKFNKRQVVDVVFGDKLIGRIQQIQTAGGCYVFAYFAEEIGPALPAFEKALRTHLRNTFNSNSFLDISLAQQRVEEEAERFAKGRNAA